MELTAPPLATLSAGRFPFPNSTAIPGFSPWFFQTAGSQPFCRVGARNPLIYGLHRHPSA